MASAAAARAVASRSRGMFPASRALAGMASVSRRDLPSSVSTVCIARSRGMSSTTKKLKKEWNDMDLRSKLSTLELVGKCIMLGLSGSWGLMLANTVLNRVEKSEAAVNEIKEAVDQVKVVLANSEQRSLQHREEVNVKFQNLRNEVNQLKCYKDVWFAHGYNNTKSCDDTVPAPGEPGDATVPAPGAQDKP